jgi:hypothetical protein
MIGTKLSSFQTSMTMTSTTVNVGETAKVCCCHCIKSYFTLLIFLSILKTNPDNISETIQTSSSTQANDQDDQEIDDAEIDKIVVNKVI